MRRAKQHIPALLRSSLVLPPALHGVSIPSGLGLFFISHSCTSTGWCMMPWVLGAGRGQGIREGPRLLEHASFNRAKAFRAGCLAAGCPLPAATCPSLSPLCSNLFSLCQSHLKAQQQRGPASQELTALKTQNGKKNMCVSPTHCASSV